MSELEKAIEGYNKERFDLTMETFNTRWHKHDQVGLRVLQDRIKQIDANIERLLTLKYIPNIK